MKDRPDNGKITGERSSEAGPSQKELDAIKSLYAQADAIVSGSDAVPQGAHPDDTKEETAGGSTAGGEDGPPLSPIVPAKDTCREAGQSGSA